MVFKGHPRGLFVLFATEMWERFSYYGMRALLIYYLTRHFLMSDDKAYALFGSYAALVYAMPVIGGLLADRYMGARKSVTIGAILLSLGHLTMAIEGAPAERIMLASGEVQLVQDEIGLQALYLALALIIVGVGFLKPNISTLVGKLYDAGDPRRDGGFTLFYMGINLGAFVATLVCGYLGETYGWAYGFGLAGIGMMLGLFTFLRGQKYLYGHAEPPDPELLSRPRWGILSIEHLIWIGALLAIVVIWQLVQIDYVVSAFLLLVAAVAVLWLLVFSLLRCTPRERNNMLVMLLLIVSSVLFWSLFEQAGTSLSLFAERSVDRGLGLFGIDEIVPSQFQSLNPLFIILLAPLFAALWQKCAANGRDPSLPAKFSLGILQVGLGFAVLVLGAGQADEAGKVAMLWLVFAYLLHTTGELCLSPVGLSMVTRLSVPKVVGMVMGVWFLSSAFAANIGALIAKATNLNTEGGDVLQGTDALQAYTDVFAILAAVALLVGGLLLAASPFLARRINESSDSELIESAPASTFKGATS